MASNENFYKRMREIAGIKSVNESKNETKNTTLIDFERANNGTAYGIVKENHHYYIKKSNKNGDVRVTDFIFINGVENKRDYQYKSLGEAEKQRNFYVKGINEAFSQGGVYNIHETVDNTTTPSLDVNEDFSSLLKRRIEEGKKNIDLEREKKFKSSLPKNKNVELNTKRGLMPEAADKAVKKALGILNEEEIITADSEINAGESLANKDGEGKESAQAPINDENAKSEAEKRTATSGNVSSEVISGNNDIVAEDVDKGDPFEDKAKIQAGGDEVTADSDAKDVDRVDNETKVEKEDAPYNNHNQPEKGHKEEKGEELKPKESKKDIVAEGEEEQPESDPFADKENAGDEKGDIVAEENDLITADSELEAANALANLTKTNLPDAIAEGDVEDAMGDEDAKKVAYQDMRDSGENVVENKDISTADSEIKKSNIEKSNLKHSPDKDVKGTSKSMNDNAIAEGEEENAGGEKGDVVAEAGEEEIEAAVDAVNDLDSVDDTPPAENPVSDVEAPVTDDSEEAPVDDDSEEAPVDDTPPVDGDVESPESDDTEEAPVDDDSGETPEGDSKTDDLVVKEIEKLVGKVTQKIRTTDLEPSTAEGFLKSIVSSFEDKLPEIDVQDRKKVADDILQAEESEESEVDNETNDKELGDGEYADIETGSSEENEEEEQVKEDSPMVVNGEEVMDDQIPDGKGGTFEQYMESRGYDPKNMGECSVSEMGGLISGYVSDKENFEDDEIKNIAEYMTEEVCNELIEYGHDSFAEMAKPHIKEDGVKFGSHEPMISDIGMAEGDAEDMDDDGDIDSDDYLAKKDHAIKKAMNKNENDDIEDVDVEDNVETPEEDVPTFSPAAEIMGGGVVKPEGAKTKSVDVDLQSGRVNVTMSESEIKFRKYIKNKIEELVGKRKPAINENLKSEKLRKIDKLIEEQWKLFGNRLMNK